MNTRRLVLLGVFLLTTLQILSQNSENSRNSVIGQEFDTKKFALINDVWDECHVLDPFNQPTSDSCIDKLAEYFSDQPVWEQSMVYYPMLDRLVSEGPLLNRRPYTLGFSQSDVTGNVPVWSDIFDGKVEERARTIEQVFQNETCKQLLNPGAIRTDVDVLDQCRSQELVKYAIYLDACLTGIKRINKLLLNRTPIDNETRYEQVTKEWDRRLRGKERKIAQADLNESMMHAVWMLNTCKHIPTVKYDDAFRLSEWNPQRVSVSVMARELQNTHDAAMSISARSGDAWAIQGFYVRELRLDREYWKSLYTINPLLFHRWMTVVGSALGLAEKEIAMHALKAYDLEKDLLDNPNFEDYIKWHDLSPNGETILSLKEQPLQDDQLMKRWVNHKTTD